MSASLARALRLGSRLAAQAIELAEPYAAPSISRGAPGWLATQRAPRFVSERRGFAAEAQECAETISVTFKDEKDGTSKTVKAPLGKSLLEVAHENDIDLEGACEGSLACSTCHLIVEDKNYFDKIPEATDDENDMLDLAFGLTDTSRLGCQVVATKDLDGVTVRIPSATRNFSVDGFRPKPH